MTHATTSKRLLVASLFAVSAVLAGCDSKEEKAVKFAESGVEYMEAGDYESADLQFNNALFQDGTNLVALRGAAQIAKEREAYERQARMLLRILDILPEDLEANAEYGRLALLAGDIDRAKMHTQKVLDQQPDNVEALTTMGAVLVLDNQIEEATAMLQQALANDPDNPEIFNLLAATSIREENFEQAMATINEGIEKADNPETLLVVKLVLAERFEGRDAVIDTFEQLIEVAPDNGAYRQRLADYYLLKDRDFAKARAQYIDSLNYLDERTEVYMRIVAIDNAERGEDAAIATLQRFMVQSPEDVDLKFALPGFYCQIQEFEKCRESFERLSIDQSLSEEDRLRAVNGIGDVSVAMKDFDRAASAADEVLEADPGNAGALVTKGQLLMIEEKPEEAIELFREALQSEPDNAEGRVYMALAYEQLGQTQFADAEFARTLDQIGYEKSIVTQYRAFLRRQNEQERSDEVLERYIRSNQTDADALMEYTEMLLRQDRFEEAENAASRLLQAPKLKDRAKFALAAALAAQEKYEEALPYAQEIVAAEPDNRRAFILQAGILRALDRGEEVEQSLRAKINSGKADAGDYTLLGDVLRQNQRFDEAKIVADEGIEAFPEVEGVYTLGYLAESQAGNRENSLTYLTRGIATASTSVRLRTLLSNDHINNAEYEEAIEVLKSIQMDNALNPLTANNLASLMLDQGGNDEEALAIARTFEGTTNPYFADTLGWAYFKNGQVENAVRYARQAAQEVPENADVLYHLGVIEAAQGNTSAASAALDQAKAAHTETNQTPMADIDAAIAALNQE